MSLLDKLQYPLRKNFGRNDNNIVSFTAESRGAINKKLDDRDSTLCLGTEQVRILLFQECEWRGRRVLFDSQRLENRRYKNESSVAATKEKSAEDSTSSLSDMVFGTVAMTYKGSSFKVHSMKSPPCIMCTKVFPVTEHSTYKQNERLSNGMLTRSTHVDSNTSNSSLRTSSSRPSSGNMSSNDLFPDPRKNSTCSSNSSGWDLDALPQMGSSQSLESSGSSGIGSSLSSLRRRWLRAVSTSLSRSDSDDIFGIQQYGESGSEGGDKHYRRRLGLMMLVRLTQGYERRIETRLLEHMTLLEGMLDRLRYFCIESNGVKGRHGTCKGMDPADRMYRASYRFVLSLLRLLINANGYRPPLLWHDVLLNSVITFEMNSNILHRGLQQMCQLLDEVDTKSTNFFLSTVVTAVLMYHLGWVYTILPAHDRQVMEKLGRRYPCNPLWAQLGDLYGATGNPVKVTQTLVVGDSRKTDLINSVLSFLSYFVRSGIVQKQREYRCAINEDVQEAINLLEQVRVKRPYLFDYTKPRNVFKNDRSSRSITGRESRSPTRGKRGPTPRVETARRVDERAGSVGAEQCENVTDGIGERSRSVETLGRSLKRSSTMKVDLDRYMLKADELYVKSTSRSMVSILPDGTDHEKSISGENVKKSSKPSQVKIVVSEIDSEDVEESKDDEDTQLRRLNIVKKMEENGEGEEEKASFLTSKPEEKCESQNIKEEVDKKRSPENNFSSLNEPVISDDNKRYQVYFTLGCEEKPSKYLSRPPLSYNCQCSYMFTTVPSTSAQLPEGVLRKIIQRNFPESSKSMQPPPGSMSSMSESNNTESKLNGVCPRCQNQSFASARTYKGTKELLETPTNATEVLRTCGNADRTVGMSRSNSLEALMEASSVIELPMPRSKLVPSEKNSNDETGFTKTLLQTRVPNSRAGSSAGGCTWGTNYTWGLVVQGLVKKDKKRRKRRKDKQNDEKVITEAEIDEDDWWCCVRDEVLAGVRFPTIDQPVAEAVCILADLDTWHVGILSNNTPSESPPLPVGMSRLVANMLEAFSYVWRKYHSPLHCVDILESKLREMWLRSEALAEMLLAADVCDVSIATLTNALDLDAADIPLLLAVATTHSPEIAQRFGLTLA